jgi:hypothetical protein
LIVPEGFAKNSLHTVSIDGSTNVLFGNDEADAAVGYICRQSKYQQMLARDFEASVLEYGLEVRSAQ